MAVDLSHVGNRTSLEAIEASYKPVAITHANPHTLAPHARNKPDEVLDALRDNGGVIGLTVYRNIVGDHTTAEKWSELVAWTVDRIGLEHVGIGTDFDQTGGMPYVEWMRQGRWTREAQYGAGSKDQAELQPHLDWFGNPSQFGNVEGALRHRGFDSSEVAAIMGGNWLRFYEQVFTDL
jgi:microsomal dipeptidase-like Zn-dependent dipeptidase